MEAVEKTVLATKQQEAEQAAKNAEAAREVKEMQERLAAQKADAIKHSLELMSTKTASPSQPQIQVIVQPAAGSNLSATENAVQKTLEAIRAAMNNGGAEKITAAAPGATFTFDSSPLMTTSAPAETTKTSLSL